MYQKGDKFKVVINTEERFFRYADGAVDFIANYKAFKVDRYELFAELKALNEGDIFVLNNAFKIERIS